MPTSKLERNARKLQERLDLVLDALCKCEVPRDAFTGNALLTLAVIDLRQHGVPAQSIISTVRRTANVPVQIIREGGSLVMRAGCAGPECKGRPTVGCGRCYVPLCESCVVEHTLVCASGALENL